jgi:hypothetical protein
MSPRYVHDPALKDIIQLFFCDQGRTFDGYLEWSHNEERHARSLDINELYMSAAAGPNNF